MEYRILYEPFKTLEKQDKAEQRIRREIEMPIAIYDERSELEIAIIEGTIVYLPLLDI
jgi:hypothetical protein